MTPRQLMRWHPMDKWTRDSFLLNAPCRLCGKRRQIGRECYDRHGWYGLCERDFRRCRTSQGRRDK